MGSRAKERIKKVLQRILRVIGGCAFCPGGMVKKETAYNYGTRKKVNKFR
jgi:hypothetical protein